MSIRSSPFSPPSRPGGMQAPEWHRQLLSLPFDSLRWAHASAVQNGLAERSLRASGRFEQALVCAEQLTLGPWARRV